MYLHVEIKRLQISNVTIHILANYIHSIFILIEENGSPSYLFMIRNCERYLTNMLREHFLNIFICKSGKPLETVVKKRFLMQILM